jgi:hypothetical protein
MVRFRSRDGTWRTSSGEAWGGPRVNRARSLIKDTMHFKRRYLKKPMLESAAASLSRLAFGDAPGYDLVGVGRRHIEVDGGALQSEHLDSITSVIYK